MLDLFNSQLKQYKIEGSVPQPASVSGYYELSYF